MIQITKKTSWYPFQNELFVHDNPPYIQLRKNGGELGKRYKDVGYQSFASTGDIYALFYELGIKLLNNNGILCYITSNKWMRAKYGQKLRQFLKQNTGLIQLIDLGPNVFEAAEVDTNILIAQKAGLLFTKPQACSLLGSNNKNKTVFGRSLIKDCSVDFILPSSGKQWLILNPIERSIKQKVERYGTPLKEWDIQINIGVITGYNKAFIVDNKVKRALIEEDPKSAEILKPILRGKDIKRYGAEWAGLWLINTLPYLKININKYPAIKNHLLQFGKDRLEQKGVVLDDGRRSRKRTNNRWFETSDSCAYHEQFEKPKVVYRNLSSNFIATYDTEGFFTNQKCYIVTGNHLRYLTLFLNSSVNNFYFKRYLGATLGQAFEMNKFLVNQIPTPKPDSGTLQKVYLYINQVANNQSRTLISEINNLFYSMYDFNKTEIGFIEEYC